MGDCGPPYPLGRGCRHSECIAAFLCYILLLSHNYGKGGVTGRCEESPNAKGKGAGPPQSEALWGKEERPGAPARLAAWGGAKRSSFYACLEASDAQSAPTSEVCSDALTHVAGSNSSLGELRSPNPPPFYRQGFFMLYRPEIDVNMIVHVDALMPVYYS